MNIYFCVCKMHNRTKILIHYVINSTYHILDFLYQAVPHETFFNPVECVSSAHVPEMGSIWQAIKIFFCSLLKQHLSLLQSDEEDNHHSLQIPTYTCINSATTFFSKHIDTHTCRSTRIVYLSVLFSVCDKVPHP